LDRIQQEDIWGTTIAEIVAENDALTASLAAVRADHWAVQELLTIAIDLLRAALIRERQKDARIRQLTRLAEAVRLAA
jgi:hypothetical protein